MAQLFRLVKYYFIYPEGCYAEQSYRCVHHGLPGLPGLLGSTDQEITPSFVGKKKHTQVKLGLRNHQYIYYILYIYIIYIQSSWSRSNSQDVLIIVPFDRMFPMDRNMSQPLVPSGSRSTGPCHFSRQPGDTCAVFIGNGWEPLDFEEVPSGNN